MDQGFIDILKTIIKEQGKEALIDSIKCKSFLADYTKGEFKKESRFLLQALEAKLPKLIDKEQDIEICFKKSVRIIVEDYGMGEGIAVDLVDTLIHVLKGVPFPKRETASQENESKNKPNKEAKKESTFPKEQYYITLNGTNSGPFELETMKEKIKKGELKRDTSVWKEGMKEWAAASAVKELSSFLPPSALPPAPEAKLERDNSVYINTQRQSAQPLVAPVSEPAPSSSSGTSHAVINVALRDSKKAMLVKCIYPFTNSFFEILTDLTTFKIKDGNLYRQPVKKPVSGLSAWIGISGDIEGRLIINMDRNIAVNALNKYSGEAIDKQIEYMFKRFAKMTVIHAGYKLNELGYNIEYTDPVFYSGSYTEKGTNLPDDAVLLPFELSTL